MLLTVCSVAMLGFSCSSQVAVDLSKGDRNGQLLHGVQTIHGQQNWQLLAKKENPERDVSLGHFSYLILVIVNHSCLSTLKVL